MTNYEVILKIEALSDTNFKLNYQSHLMNLALKGLQPKPIEAYSRRHSSNRRIL